MILGESGRGKSRSIKFLNPEETMVIKCTGKPLPFKSTDWKKWNGKSGSWIQTDDYGLISKIIVGAHKKGKKIVVIDDAQYLMANEFMRRSSEKGFDKFTEIAKNFWSLVQDANNKAHEDMRIYFLMHTESDQMGNTKAKTIGKMLDEKITLEGMFTVVLKAIKDDKNHYFTTQNSGSDTCKSPEDMFEENRIENNLLLVDSAICEYYGIEDTHEEEADEE
jgi:hypothetical protein